MGYFSVPVGFFFLSGVHYIFSFEFCPLSISVSLVSRYLWKRDECQKMESSLPRKHCITLFGSITYNHFDETHTVFTILAEVSLTC